jgi:hypothetical protein
MTKNVVPKTWNLTVYGNRRYSTNVPPGGGGGNWGTVGSFANLNLLTSPVYTMSVAFQDYSIFATQGGIPGTGTDTYNANGWPIGNNPFVRFTPPTIDGYERGMNFSNLYQNATLGFHKLNYRFQWRASNNWCSMLGTGPKWCIVHTVRNLVVGNADDRPVLFIRAMNSANNPALNRALTWVLGPAMDTTQGWGPLPYDDRSINDTPPGTLDYNPNSVLPFYFTNSTDTGTFQGNPLIPAGEVIEVEHRAESVASAEFPRGVLGFRLYRQNGDIFQSAIPWDWDATVPFGSYIQEIQQIGMGQYNTAPGANLAWMDVGPYVTLARDFNGWLGTSFGTTPP